MEQNKIRVLIVDDSGIKAAMLKHILESDEQIEVIAIAKNGKEGLDKTLSMSPDVITMDIDMPVMNGFEAIEAIMQQKPTPIIAVSTLEAKTVVKVLSIGAMEFVTVSQEWDDTILELLTKIKIASRVKPLRRMNFRPQVMSATQFDKETQHVITIGVSTGGPAALQQLFKAYPKDLPAAVMVVQHIATGFICELASYLQIHSGLKISVAHQHDRIENGHVYFAPDGFHMVATSAKTICLVDSVDTNTTFTPSIDIMMKSVAEVYGANTIGIIMTGMGRDGVEGIRAIHQAQGVTIAQDESTSVIYGMNRIAVENGDIHHELPLDMISLKLAELFKAELQSVQ